MSAWVLSFFIANVVAYLRFGACLFSLNLEGVVVGNVDQFWRNRGIRFLLQHFLELPMRASMFSIGISSFLICVRIRFPSRRP